MDPIEKINEYLNNAGTFYLSTIDNNKPKCRPLGMTLLNNDHLYFGVGTFKEVYQQMVNNPYVEIIACKDGTWIRYNGKAVFTQDDTIAALALEQYPHLKNIYNESTGNQLGMFYLVESHVEFKGIMDTLEEYDIE